MRRYRAKQPSYIILGLLFLFLGFLPSKTVVPPRLIQVAKNQPNLEAILFQEQIECLQELAQSYLLKAGRVECLNLRRQGINFRFLPFYDPTKVYLVARIRQETELDLIKTLGLAVKLEENDFLVVIRSLEVLDEFPVTVKKKLLPASGLVLTPQTWLGEEYTWRLAPDELYENLANQVSTDNLLYQVTALQNFGTRYTLTSNCLSAGQYLYDYFLSLGLQPRYQEFYLGGYLCRNVIADLPGQSYPEQVAIICAHYDSTSDQRWTLAPGADDNASGTAAVMEAARILKNYPLDFTVRFILFSAEEQGLVGSQYYVQDKLNPEETILGVINLDMIAYADQRPEDLDVIGNVASSWLADLTVNMTQVYGVAPAKKIIDYSFIYSDHASFWNKNIAAICAIEDENVPNPYYHKTSDTVDTLNFEFFQSSSRGTLVTLADLAQPIRPGYPPSPKQFSLSLSYYASIFSSLRKVYLIWSQVPGASGYNLYRGNYPRGHYQKLNSNLIGENGYQDILLSSDLPYYYAVTAVDAQGRESNFSKLLMIPADIGSGSSLLSQWQRLIFGLRN